mmetsp:Transcript_111022/g.277968  ORF Transcript_111022/g.277968 Transcript_111022/m.277968 type:complete len:290 (+) Transcript_111022:37-906(+)
MVPANESHDEAARQLRGRLSHDACVICILGGTEFRGTDSEALVKTIAPQLEAAMGSSAIFVTGGMAGVQETFAKHCGDGSRVWNLLPMGQSSGYGRGTDINAGANLEERKAIFGLIGDIYITVEGGPGVSEEASVAHARGAVVVPLGRTGGASSGMFDFPVGALQRPCFSTEEQWTLLASKDASVEESAAALIAIVEKACIDAFITKETPATTKETPSAAPVLMGRISPAESQLGMLQEAKVANAHEAAPMLQRCVLCRPARLGAVFVLILVVALSIPLTLGVRQHLRG